MASSIEICNTALILIGQEPIITLDDTSKQARLCKRLYNSTLEGLLRQYPWTFAIRRVILSPDAEVPSFGYSRQFTLPSDCLRIVDIRFTDCEYDWLKPGEVAVERGKILANEEIIYLRYVGSINDPNLFDTQFRDVLSYRLAGMMCHALTADQDLLTKLKQMEIQALQLAMHTSAIENKPQPVHEGNWIPSRY